MKRGSPQALAASRVAFEKWLASNPREGDRPFGAFGVRYQVARYCDYLDANPCQDGDPLRDARVRDEAVSAYRLYLATFAPASAVAGILDNLDHFYLFLGLGPVARRPDSPSATTGA